MDAEGLGRVGGHDADVAAPLERPTNHVLEGVAGVVALGHLDLVHLDHAAVLEPAGADDAVDLVGDRALGH